MGYTVAQIVEKIQAALPPVDPNLTADFLHTGNPAAEVTGIVVSFQATRAVCEETIRRGANMIITHEPTFYVDGQVMLADDPVVEAKKAFIAEKKLAIWRCHDAWHLRSPDGIVTGMAQALGWKDYTSSESERVFDLPAQTTLKELIAHVKQRLQIPMVRYIGEETMPVRRVAYSAGCPGWGMHRRLLHHPGVDVLLIGESREWETTEYVRDHRAAGAKKALVVLGHAKSEEQGMRYLGEWLQPILPGVEISFIPAGDPYSYA